MTSDRRSGPGCGLSNSFKHYAPPPPLASFVFPTELDRYSRILLITIVKDVYEERLVLCSVPTSVLWINKGSTGKSKAVLATTLCTMCLLSCIINLIWSIVQKRKDIHCRGISTSFSNLKNSYFCFERWHNVRRKHLLSILQ